MADDRDRDDIRAEFVRRLVLARCPELSLIDLEIAFDGGARPDRSEDVWAQIAAAVGDAIEALEERLTELERGLPGRMH